MAKIIKIVKDDVQAYPQTITNAIADIRVEMTLSYWMWLVDKRLQALETVVGSGSTTEYIDNLGELLDFFKGTKDDTTFIDVLKAYIEKNPGYDFPDTPIDVSTVEYPTFDDMFGNNGNG